ncbi:E3 ubiquitin-protein ligase UPL2 [Acorus gramineus]|uniref:HECT-type E3 ubiquitin transferase n=1 Tax=Acorus gramineus TaxID=55184 RepID=A0AAV9AZ83_ACOGR|nr:E3 ubiquitin-protein ligase UPL2 [Acorus gramineus]
MGPPDPLSVSSRKLVETSSRSQSSSLHVIHIPELHLQKEDDLVILKQCIDQYNVPPEHRFSLLTRIRYARAFRSPQVCRLYSRISILAFLVLVQSNDAHDELVSFFANEPEYTNELIRLVRSEDAIPGDIRTLAMLALGAQLAAYSSSHERAKILSGSNIIPAGGNRLTLLNVLQKAVLSHSNPSDPSSVMFVDALLQFYLLHVISSSSSGSAIRGSGMVPTLLPFLQDVNPVHMHLVCSAVKILQKLMDYSSQAVNSFKECGGVELLAQRLQTEIQRVIDAPDDKSSMVIGDSLKFDDDCLYSQRRLIKALLKALGSATYTPTNPIRSQNSLDNPIPSSLALIFRNVLKFGGDIYFSAVTVMNEIIHKDPTCFPALHEAGLPDAFLSSVTSGILPSSKALTCIPSGLGAICLNVRGLEAVRECDALRFLYHTFTARKYLVAMNEAVVPLANAVEELLRHVTSLKSTGVEIIIEIINKLISLGHDVDVCSGKSDASSFMETDSEDKEVEGQDNQASASDSIADSISNERFVQLCIFHLMVLLHRTMENTETCKLFVEKKGIEALMRLLLRPSISQSSEGMSIALYSTVVFKGFTQNHAAPLAHAFCSALGDYLKKALREFSSISGSFLLIPTSTPDSGLFSSLSIIEFLLFLAASKDTRWMAALLTEFGNQSKDVLEDIGRIHREVLWQIALIEDSRPEEDDPPVGESLRVDSSLNETEDHRFSSFRPLAELRRRTPGWSIESQFFDLINLSRDVGRVPGVPHRLGIDGPSNLRLSSQLHVSNPSSSSDAGTSIDGDNQRSHASTCRDMIRSISFHINYLFLELGKVILIPSRRGGEPSNVTPSAKSVVSTITSVALDHLNFIGHVDPLKTEASMSTKCRYLGKVIDFIDCIIAEKPEACNPILLNCFYVHGVIQAILTTFEATSQLLFALNRPPASPMEMDDPILKDDAKEETDYGWIYGPLVSYGTLMDRLVTSSFIISSSSRNLLVQPMMSGGSVTAPRNPETFVKVLQSKVLKAVLPIWSHPLFTECNFEFIAALISIMRHIYSGVEDTKANVSSAAGNIGLPLDEAAVSAVMEMGFSRSRAEEAFRQVGTNIVEMALDWLCTHPEEPEEEDDLARAVAMSLGDAPKEDEVPSGGDLDQEKEIVEPPPVDELLSACNRLLQVKDSLAFPVQGLLAMICAQNDGRYRYKVVTFIIDQLKVCTTVSDSRNDCMLSALFHVLALVLHEDAAAREVASTSGLIRIALDLLSQWNPDLHGGEKSSIPKWVTASFLAIDQMLLVDQKLSLDVKSLEALKGEDERSQTSIMINDLQSPVKSSPGSMEVHEERRLIEIACRCIRHQLPSETMHAVLQLCATVTKVHSAALSFLDAGGLPALLSLPTSSLFSGFDSVAATIVRHILEDPYTLQQAMEAEIRHSFVAVTNRHSNGRLSPRNFLQSLGSVISRDPAVFMQAAQSVCQIEMVGERPYVVLLKDREKKSKEKEKEKTSEKDKQPSPGGKTSSIDAVSPVPGNVHSKPPESNIKNVKVHRKSPPSFTSVIELLLDYVITFVPPLKDNDEIEGTLNAPPLVDMDIDGTVARGKGKAIVGVSEESGAADQEASAVLAKTVFILKLLTDILMTYASSVHVLLRKDAEVSNSRGPPQRVPSGTFSGGIFHHVLHNFLPYSGSYKKDKKADSDWRQRLANRASQFLVASSVRSSEGRKRIFIEINNVFNDFVGTSSGVKTPDFVINAFIDLLNDILGARSPSGSYILAEVSTTCMDVGMVQTLTKTLRVLDLDHPDSPRTATAIVKALDSVTKEYVHSADPNSVKADSSMKPANDQNQPHSGVNGLQSSETTSQPDHHGTVDDRMEPFNSTQASGSSDSITDDMEHDRDIDGGFAAEAEDDFMHEASEEAGPLENGIATIGITIDISHNVQDNLVDEDDDEEMSGDDVEEADGDDEDDEDEDNNDLEDDDVHRLSHPDTDQNDHDMDEDEFDEDVLEEDEDDDEEDDEDGVILRLEEGINGINVLDHLEVFGRDDSFPNDALHVEVFGSRRTGRTTSLYNLLGRTGDSAAPSQHPLLTQPSSSLHHPVRRRPTGKLYFDHLSALFNYVKSYSYNISFKFPDNSGDLAFLDRNMQSVSSQLDTIFRSLRSGRHGHRFNMWVDEGQTRTGSGAPAIPPGIEEVLVSRLRRPTSEQSSEENATGQQPQDKVEPNQMQESDAVAREEPPVDENTSNVGTVNTSLRSTEVGVTGNLDVGPIDNDFLQGGDASNAREPAIEMQYERGSDATSRDVEAVSQESGGSGATLGESLRSLEVEIGSADGHDDGERQGPTDRISLSDLQPPRARRSSGNPGAVSGREASLRSVSEVPPDTNQVPGQAGSAEEQNITQPVDLATIDPAFLDALPEELRAEVLSSQQRQATQTPNEQTQPEGDIDPEFLAALPPDIREEVLAQQRAAQRGNHSQELEGQPVEMDTVSIIATFPSDLREEVLLTSSDAILANLTPALVAEAQMLRERRGEGIGSSLDRGRRSVGGKLVEADGAPLVDMEDLKALVRLLRVVQPIYKGPLQRVLLNLCVHRESRTALVKILMDTLMRDLRGPMKSLNGSGEPSFRLYACQSHIIYSRPQFCNGVPPLLSRRILETLTYLARNHPYVAKFLLHMVLPQPATPNSLNAEQDRGKAVMIMEEDQSERLLQQKGDTSIVLLLSLLNQSLYLRSVAHLEQLLNLLEVIIDSTDDNSALPNKSGVSPPEPQAGSESAMVDVQVNAVVASAGDNKLIMTDDHTKSSASAVNDECNTRDVLLGLPQSELRLLCSLLAREGLSDNAYGLVAEIMKKLVAIIPTHCRLFITELANSVQQLIISAMNELHGYEEIETLLNTSSSDGTTILRVLQALSSLISTLHEKEKDCQLLPEKDLNDALSLIWNIDAALEPLWLELSTCISKIESFSESSDRSGISGNQLSTNSSSMPPLPAGSQNILPYIESFFVTCEKLCPGESGSVHDFSNTMSSDIEDASNSTVGQKSPGTHSKVDEKHHAFVKFSERHKKLLNAFIRQNSGLLEKSFSLMLKVPRIIDFDNKRNYFRSKIKHQHDHHHSPLRISVRRAYVLEDSYNQLRMRSTQDLKGRLTVNFQGEEGIDAGGLTREWYQLLSRVGKALFDGQLLDVHFTRSFYKHILGVKVTYHDIEAIDPDYFKNLKWMLENDVSEIPDLTFSIDADEEKLILYERTEVTDYELIPGGRNIRVTEENKREYVDLNAEHRLTTAIRPQINAFLEGFNELIPRELVSIFNDKELELLISGLPDIDLDDMRENTEYSGYSPASPVIQWFWEVVQGFSEEDKARLLQFVTGTSKVPLEGFSALQGISGSQKFQIHKAYGSPDHLPSAHTCFNQLDLPEYPSKEQLEERLLLAIHEANEGFGFG